MESTFLYQQLAKINLKLGDFSGAAEAYHPCRLLHDEFYSRGDLYDYDIEEHLLAAELYRVTGHRDGTSRVIESLKGKCRSAGRLEKLAEALEDLEFHDEAVDVRRGR